MYVQIHAVLTLVLVTWAVTVPVVVIVEVVVVAELVLWSVLPVAVAEMPQVTVL